MKVLNQLRSNLAQIEGCFSPTLNPSDFKKKFDDVFEIHLETVIVEVT